MQVSAGLCDIAYIVKTEKVFANILPMKRYPMMAVAVFLAILAAGQGSAEWKALAESYARKNHNQPLVVAVVRDGQATYYSFGLLSREKALPPDENTIFEIGALSGVFTTTLMVKEAMEGRFELSQPIRDFIPEDIDAPLFQPQKCVEVVLPASPGGQARRILSCTPDPLGDEVCMALCDLATHTSGLPNSGTGLYDWHPIGTAFRLTGPRPGFTREAFYRQLADYPLKAMPGAGYRFSNLGIALIGHLLSEINGRPFDALLTDELLLPLGINDVSFQLSPAQQERLARGHNDKGKAVPYWNFDAMAPAAGLKASARGLAVFVQANLRNDNSRWALAMEQAQQARVDVSFPGLTRPTQAGYGWLISQLSPESNQPVVWMYGGTEGFRAFAGFIKDQGLGVVVLSASAAEASELGFSILETIYEGSMPEGARR